MRQSIVLLQASKYLTEETVKTACLAPLELMEQEGAITFTPQGNSQFLIYSLYILITSHGPYMLGHRASQRVSFQNHTKEPCQDQITAQRILKQYGPDQGGNC